MIRKLSHLALLAVALWVVERVRPGALSLPHPWLSVLGLALLLILQPQIKGETTSVDRWTAPAILLGIVSVGVLASCEALLCYPTPVNWILDAEGLAGLALACTGLALRTWSIKTLGASFTMQVTVQRGQRLVTDGPYRWLAHPSYLGAALVLWGLTLFVHAWWTLLASLVMLPVVYAWRIHVEERVLLRELPGYAAYVWGARPRAPQPSGA